MDHGSMVPAIVSHLHPCLGAGELITVDLPPPSGVLTGMGRQPGAIDCEEGWEAQPFPVSHFTEA